MAPTSSTDSTRARQVRPRRSVLYMPGVNERALAKGRSLPADALVLDLEDAVAPDAKSAARASVAAALDAGGYGRRERVVRINGLGTEWFDEDVRAVAKLPVDAVLLPKVESAAQARDAIAALDRAGGPADLPLWAMIETARGVLAVAEIAAASPRLDCLVMGTSDLGAELRVPHTPERIGFLALLSACVLAARANRLDILDGVQLDLDDEEGFRAVCRQGRALGFDGKTLIHPRQIGPCNEVFTPSTAEVENAAAVIDAWEQAAARGLGVAVVNGQLVERLHADDARRVIALVDAIEA